MHNLAFILLPIAAAGYSLLHLLLGGGFFVAIVILSTTRSQIK